MASFVESSLDNIKSGMKAFNTILQKRKKSDIVVPYFLYVITQNDDDKLISMAVGDHTGDHTGDDTSEIISNVITNNSPVDTSISDVINRHISGPLKNLYKPSSTSADSDSDSFSIIHEDSAVSNLSGDMGGSRKNRRRHKQKKNKHTKRRTRK